MLKPYTNEPKKPAKQARDRSSGARPAGRRLAAVAEDGGNPMVLMTIGSVVLSTIVAVSFLTPLIHAAAIFPFYYAAMKRHGYPWCLTLIVRWALALLVTTVAIGAFVPGRMAESLPLVQRTALTIEAWVTEGGPPVADYGYLFWGMAAFLAASAASGGVLAFILGSIAVTGAAFGTLFLFEHGVNIVQIAAVAIPIWQWSFFAACVFLLVPAALPVFESVFKTERVTEERRIFLNYLYIGAGLFLLSLLLRLATAEMWQRVVQRWTVF